MATAHRQKKQKKAKAVASIKRTASENKNALLLPLLAVLLLTVIAFFPSLQNGFVNWDDPDFISNNSSIRSLSNIPYFFKSTVLGAYAPLVFTSYALEYQLFELNPFYYHLDNLLLHLACVFLVYRIGLQLQLSTWSAAFLALLFGIHPMRVESVAWITERKDVLYGVFYLAALLQYTKYLTIKNKKYLYLALLCFVPALFSKIQAVALPLSFLALDYYFKRPLKLNLIGEKIPFFALSAIIGLVGVYFLSQQKVIDVGAYTVFQSMLVGTYSLMTYLIKWIVPFPLATLYPYPHPDFGFTWQLYLSLPVILAFFGGLVYCYKKNYRALLFGFLFFLANIVFMLQIVGAGQGYLADRYTYIPYLGLFFILAYSFDFFSKKENGKYKQATYIAAGIMLGLYSLLTWQQNKTWENSETLWTNAINHYPESIAAWKSRGDYYESIGAFQKARQDYEQALLLDAKDLSIYKNYGKLLFNTGEFGQAIELFTKGLAIDAQNADLYLNRGAAYAAAKQFPNALADMNKVLELQPTETEAYLNRSNIYFETGQAAPALQDMTKYLSINPNFAEGWFRKGLMNRALGNFQVAIQDFTKAINLHGQKGAYYFERARVYQALGDAVKGNADMAMAQQLGI